LYGTTRNPYNLSRYISFLPRSQLIAYKFIIFERIVGGSSGGEGCIVGSAGSIMGIGSDIGGSIRIVKKEKPQS
jgi:Asp-tRNA(Asn)/Glu-tRNA(Gln) amidotransferase A subunit family amidase